MSKLKQPDPTTTERNLRALLQEAHDVIVACIAPLDWNSLGTVSLDVDVLARTHEAKMQCVNIHNKLNDALGGDCCKKRREG